jgi:transcription antitermination factor NusG
MIRTTQTWYAVRFTYGVTGFVGMNKRPTAISAEEVERIMKAQLPEKIDIRVGDRVRFRWPLEYALLGFPQGIEMTIEKVSDDERVLAVSFMLANRKSVIECDYDFCQVVKVDEIEGQQEGPETDRR